MKANIDLIKDSIKSVVKKTLSENTDEIAEKVISKLKAENMVRNELSYTKKVEILISNLDNLKDAVKQKEEDIEYLEKYGLPQKSKSIVVFSSASGNPDGDRYLELKEKYKKEKEETERDIKRIEKALDKIRDDRYFMIIELRYINKEKIFNDEEIASKLEKDRSTVTRNRKRLINKLVTIIFPKSVQDLM